MKISKQDVFLHHLLTGGVTLFVDLRKPGVEMPPAFADAKFAPLTYGVNLPIPIPDVKVSRRGVHATLSFNRTPFATFIPWEAVISITSSTGDVTTYWDEAPEDFLMVLNTSGTTTAAPKPKKRKAKTEHLQAVPAGPVANAPTDPPSKKTPGKKFKLDVLKGGAS